MVRYARTAALLAAVVGLVAVLGSVGVAGPAPNPNWFNDPVQGPSPNPTHQVGSDPGGDCPQPTTRSLGFGRVTLGGNGEDWFVIVELRNQANTATIHSQFEDPDGTGNWGGSFAIPAGLAPGVYPLRATCWFDPDTETEDDEEVEFEYADRSYTVVAPTPSAEPPDPVEAEVTFTG